MHYKWLAWFTVVFAFSVIVLGAFVRLSDAGLGCPDWPGCYGRISPHHAAEDIAAVEAAQPGGPVTVAKAWKEMVHRYFAGTLGLLILALAVLAWRWRATLRQSLTLPVALVGLVVFQALLGMWTVTLLLKPAVVTAHLMGGMATLALLIWLALRQTRTQAVGGGPGLRWAAALGLGIVALQIMLGGWVSANYAALACNDFPLCRSAWMPEMDFSHAFHVFRELGMTADGGLLPQESLIAIHWMHRVGALITVVYLGLLGWLLLRHAALRRIGFALLGVLSVQVLLGISNVLLSLPLGVAVAHNAVAAMLLGVMVVLNFRLHQEDRGGSHVD